MNEKENIEKEVEAIFVTEQQPPVGTLIANRRHELGLSGYRLAERTGMAPSIIMRIENGTMQPSAEKLDLLAGVLDLEPSVLMAASGYEELATLPTFQPYLRSKYPDMPAGARNDLARAFARITKKHGFDPTETGPRPGQDE